MVGKARAFLSDQSGTPAIEYAIIGGLVSVAVIAGATLIGIGLNDMLLNAGKPL